MRGRLRDDGRRQGVAQAGAPVTRIVVDPVELRASRPRSVHRRGRRPAAWPRGSTGHAMPEMPPEITGCVRSGVSEVGAADRDAGRRAPGRGEGAQGARALGRDLGPHGAQPAAQRRAARAVRARHARRLDDRLRDAVPADPRGPASSASSTGTPTGARAADRARRHPERRAAPTRTSPARSSRPSAPSTSPTSRASSRRWSGARADPDDRLDERHALYDYGARQRPDARRLRARPRPARAALRLLDGARDARPTRAG